jgi:hypothetical protein
MLNSIGPLGFIGCIFAAIILVVAGIFWGHSTKGAKAANSGYSHSDLFLYSGYAVLMAAEVVLALNELGALALILAIPTTFVTGIIWGRCDFQNIHGRWF